MVGLLFGQVIGRLPQLPNHLGIPIVDHFAQRIAVRMNRLLWCIAMQHTFQFIAFRIPNPVVQIAAVGSAPALGDGVVPIIADKSSIAVIVTHILAVEEEIRMVVPAAERGELQLGEVGNIVFKPPVVAQVVAQTGKQQFQLLITVCRHIVLHDFQVHPYRQHLGIVGKQDVEKRIDGGEIVAVEAVGLGEEAIIGSIGLPGRQQYTCRPST